MKKKTSRARRRRRRTIAPPLPTRGQVVPPTKTPWLALGALVASTVINGATPVSAAAWGLARGTAASDSRRPRTEREIGPSSDVFRPPPLPEFGLLVGTSRATTSHAFDAHAAVAPTRDLETQSVPSAELDFSIPPGPLAEAVAAFTRVTGLRCSFTVEALGTLHSPGVAGRHSAERALAALLAGTGTRFRVTKPGEAVLELEQVFEAVEVSGRSVVVASPKYVVPMRDIPQTIAVIPRAVMETQAVTTLSEALRNVPGITLQAGEGGGASSTAGDMFNLRGFSAANSVFVDGVRDDGLVSRDTFNLEQVEVFMGPTGTDVGRGTAAGYVNMQTKAPRLSSERSMLASAGTAHQRRMTLDVNEPLSFGSPTSWAGQSAVRLNALWQDSGTPGREFVTRESLGVAPAIGFGLQSPTRVVVSAQVVRQENEPDYGVPGAAWLDAPLAPTTVRAARDVNQANFYGSPAYDYDNASQNSVLARVEHDLSPSLTLRHQARYNQTRREAVITAVQNVAAFDPATNLVALSRQGNERENRILSNLASAVSRFSTGPLRHAATAGVEVLSERQDAPGLTGLGTREPTDVFAPDTFAPVLGFAPAYSGAYSKGRVETVAAYASDAIDLGARWQVSGGLRWERYDAGFDSLTTAGVRTQVDTSGSLVSGKGGVLFRLSGSSNLYASVATTKTPPGTTNFTLSAQPNNQNNPNVRPQMSTNYEVGGKWDARGGRLSLTAALFSTRNQNVIFTVDATAIPPLFNQDDAQLVRGASLGVVGRVTDAWDVFANVAYLDTESRSQHSANAGKRLPLTPVVSGSLWTTYRLPRGATVGGGVRHTDAVYVNAANTIAVPGYRLVDLVADYPVNSHLTLRLNVSNAFDATYIRNVNNNGGRYNPGNPRAVLVTTAVKF